jgi:hypothetical protein
MMDGEQTTAEAASADGDAGVKSKKDKSWPKVLTNGEKKKPEKAPKPENESFAGHVTRLSVGAKGAAVTFEVKGKKNERKSFTLDDSDAGRLQAMVAIIATAQMAKHKIHVETAGPGNQVAREIELKSKK